jgi:hypothetical protein
VSSRYHSEFFFNQSNCGLEKFFDDYEDNNTFIQIKLHYPKGIWESMSVLGTGNFIIAIIDKLNKSVAGAMIISQCERFFNGELRETLYVSSLKVGSDYKHSVVLSRLFNEIKEYSIKNKVYLIIFSVLETNKVAWKIFQKRSSLRPVATQIGKLQTYFFKRRLLPCNKIEGLIIRPASKELLPAIHKFLEEERDNRTNFPNYSLSEIGNGEARLKCLKLEDIVVATLNGSIVGIMALWDQTGFRNWQVSKYSPSIRLTKPFVNAFFRIFNYPELPRVSEKIAYKIISLVIYREGHDEIFKHMFNCLMNREVNKNVNYSISLFDDHPLNPLFGKKSIAFSSYIYTGKYTEDNSNMNFRNFYIEAGGL